MITRIGVLRPAASTAISAQTATTTLDAVAGVPEIDKSTQTQDVQFRTERDERMTVAVRLSGAGPYRFLVDTGADRTAVSRDIVAKLKLPTGSGAQLHSVSGVSRVTTARVSQLELTHPPEQSIDAAVLESANMGADGPSGWTCVSQRVEFDFANQTMSIVPSSTPDFALSRDSRRHCEAQERSPCRHRCRRERRTADRRSRYRITGQHRQPGASPPCWAAICGPQQDHRA
jgi:predicted aspartyl protease